MDVKSSITFGPGSGCHRGHHQQQHEPLRLDVGPNAKKLFLGHRRRCEI